MMDIKHSSTIKTDSGTTRNLINRDFADEKTHKYDLKCNDMLDDQYFRPRSLNPRRLDFNVQNPAEPKARSTIAKIPVPYRFISRRDSRRSRLKLKIPVELCAVELDENYCNYNDVDFREIDVGRTPRRPRFLTSLFTGRTYSIGNLS